MNYIPEISSEILHRISFGNTMQILLNGFLDKNHNRIFNSEESKKKDYVVAYVRNDDAPSFLKKWELYEKNETNQAPEPNMSYHRKKEEVVNILSEEPYSAAAWRYSPSLIWLL